MSFLKHFGSKSSKKVATKSEKQQQPEVASDELSGYYEVEPNLQNASRDSSVRMSVSKSGRVKQQERRRSSLFENSILVIPEETKTGQAEVVNNSQQLYGNGNELLRMDLQNGNGNQNASTVAHQAATDFGNRNLQVDNAMVKQMTEVNMPVAVN